VNSDAEGFGGFVGIGFGRLLPLIDPLVDPLVDVVAMAGRAAVLPTRLATSLRRQGGRLRDRLVADGASRMDALVPRVVEQVLDRLDLTDVVLKHVDLQRVVADVDLDAAVARVDMARVVSSALAQVDLAAVAQQVVAAMDLPELVRESSNALRSDTLRGARVRSAAADQALARVRDRFLTRRDEAQPTGDLNEYAGASTPVAPTAVPPSPLAHP
jgi:hypothetical protein